MVAVNVTISAEARQRLGEIAARERRRPYSQAGLMLERLLLDPELAARLSNPEPTLILAREPGATPGKPGKP
jgi:hypothetical protein